ncbi:MAG: sulfurtransferase TusA family protein [Nitrospira sp.]|nr:sulfurtransferase TusA family protein [Nitrospira sp.]
MGKDLKLSAVKEEPLPVVPAPVEPKPAAPAPTGAPVYDLRGVACPMNYVKTKLKLEMMDAGEKLEVWLDAGEPIKNVPMSLKNDGHKLLIQEALEPEATHYRILVEKVEG